MQLATRKACQPDGLLRVHMRSTQETLPARRCAVKGLGRRGHWPTSILLLQAGVALHTCNMTGMASRPAISQSQDEPAWRKECGAPAPERSAGQALDGVPPASCVLYGACIQWGAPGGQWQRPGECRTGGQTSRNPLTALPDCAVLGEGRELRAQGEPKEWCAWGWMCLARPLHLGKGPLLDQSPNHEWRWIGLSGREEVKA